MKSARRLLKRLFYYLKREYQQKTNLVLGQLFDGDVLFISFCLNVSLILTVTLIKMKKKILVMEKDDSILEIVSYVLKDAGYNVKALNAEDGMYEQVITYKPDAILLDIIAPSTKGTEVCNTLKEDQKTKHIPVIVYSTHAKIAQTIKQVCADEVLPKPFDIDELLGVIETYVAR